MQDHIISYTQTPLKLNVDWTAAFRNQFKAIVPQSYVAMKFKCRLLSLIRSVNPGVSTQVVSVLLHRKYSTKKRNVPVQVDTAFLSSCW